MKSRLQLSETLLIELGKECSVDPTRDLLRLRESVEYRGESFLTITLPEFGSALERALDRGHIDQHDFVGPWGKLSHAGRPRFLAGFLDLLFDGTGLLRSKVDPDVVFCLRQFTLLHKKSWAIASERRQLKAIRGYLDVEGEISEDFHDPDGYFRNVAAVVIQDLSLSIPQGLGRDEGRGVHGPGATAEGFTSNQKWNFSIWHERLESVFPYSLHGVSDESLVLDPEIQARVEFLPESEEQPVKVIFVPKTMKTPRVIAIEPGCMQYAQQLVSRRLIEVVEHFSELTSGHVNFTDQSVNQRLCLESSRTGRLATLDMKEASDRVSLAHAKALFAVNPQLWALVDACRSKQARLPDGTVVPLKKFASMGSALCFPVEALAFFTAIVAARLRSRGLKVTRHSVNQYRRDVFVYGDDLIVPANEAESIRDYLELSGFKVNSSKSFWNGKFRESCGVDAYDGTEVTPTYCRFAPPDRTDCEALVSWVAMANGFYAKGLWQTAAAVRAHIENVLGRLPVTTQEIGGLAWRTYSKFSEPGRWDKNLHSVRVRTWVPTSVRRKDPLDSYAALHKCLSMLEDGVDRVGIRLLYPKSSDDEHLLTTVRRHALALKRGWVLS